MVFKNLFFLNVFLQFLALNYVKMKEGVNGDPIIHVNLPLPIEEKLEKCTLQAEHGVYFVVLNE